jgi:hypothetical protein
MKPPIKLALYNSQGDIFNTRSQWDVGALA